MSAEGYGDLGALRDHILDHSVRTGDFVLKSGRPSKWFIDSKQTVCRPGGMLLVAEAMLAVIPAEATAIGGLTMGADPVAFVTPAVGATRGRDLKAFSVRKETKDHGGGGRIAGALDPGDRVVVTEDTVTPGHLAARGGAGRAGHGGRGGPGRGRGRPGRHRRGPARAGKVSLSGPCSVPLTWASTTTGLNRPFQATQPPGNVAGTTCNRSPGGEGLGRTRGSRPAPSDSTTGRTVTPQTPGSCHGTRPWPI